MATGIKSLKKLKKLTLNLKGNKIEADGIYNLYSNIGKLKKIEEIDINLKHNYIF